MLLAIHGAPVDRQRALQLFNARQPDWNGATNRQIAEVVRAALPSHVSQWRLSRPHSASSFVKGARNSVDGTRGALVVAQCFHERHRVSAKHAFVLVAADPFGAKLLDPLGHEPRGRTNVNASIEASGNRRVRHLHVNGAAWVIDLNFQVWFLRIESQDIRPAEGNEGTRSCATQPRR
jgi:hypothetical protein